MSVARVREINARLRAAGITVHEWTGWEARGNGQTSAYEGGLIHHTASPYGVAYLSLVNGRPDLTGPLCNYAGNADGSVTCVAAHPANHAGASGGRSMGPLPVTSTFNRRVLGLEIVYPGVTPMTDAQSRTARAWARVVADVVGGGDLERVRAHAETSVTGKWDPGYANGKTIDMRAFRSEAARSVTEADMPLTNQDAELVAQKVWGRLLAHNGITLPAERWMQDMHDWYRPGTPAHGAGRMALIIDTAKTNTTNIREVQSAHSDVLADLRDAHDIPPPEGGAAVSHEQLVAALADQRVAAAWAKAQADEQDRRARDGDAQTGPTS